jgi:hypothetical protein
MRAFAFSLLPLCFFTFLLGLSPGAWTVSAQQGGTTGTRVPPNQLNPEEENAIQQLKQYWKKKARYYVKNPFVLKSREEACNSRAEQLQQQLDQLTTAYNNLEGNTSQEKLSLHDTLSDLRHRLELEKVKGDSTRLLLAYITDSMGLENLSSMLQIRDEQLAQTQKHEQLLQDRLNENPNSSNAPKSNANLFYHVQVSMPSFKKRLKEIPKSLQMHPVDSMTANNQYLFGQFVSRETAIALAQEMKGLGLSEPVVVAYKDGKPIGHSKADKMAAQQRSATEEARTQVQQQLVDVSRRTNQLENERTRIRRQIDSLNRKKAYIEQQLAEEKKRSQRLARNTPVRPAQNPDSQPTTPAETTSRPQETYSVAVGRSFRVQLYSGNVKGAEYVKAQFLKLHPEKPADVVFEEPYHKVRVGEFNSIKQATQFRDVMRKHYYDAFVTFENQLLDDQESSKGQENSSNDTTPVIIDKPVIKN